ncbi:MAG: hypothetical protein KatS3mg057_2843 [Herpetosiphonaceae bacterium]|nr:MAG: hypothetical protein KatS3mg057_2843 [Herpetosiphonaceae bacterium]
MPVVRRIAALVLCLALTACQLGQGSPPPTRIATPTAVGHLPVEAAPLPTVAPSVATLSPAPMTATSTPALHEDDTEAVRRARMEALPRDPLAIAAAFRNMPIDSSALTPAPEDADGLEIFWVTDIQANSHYTVTARLRHRSDSLLFYVAEEVAVDDAALERSSSVFEKETLPALLELFAYEIAAPQQMTVLLTPLRGAGGYYSSEDELPATVNPRSNQRPMVYINSGVLAPGTPAFDSVLAHEIQHLLHHRLQPNSSSWFNEGLSMLFERLLGYGGSFAADAFLSAPDLQLNAWADRPDRAIPHYGAAQLFLSYLYERRDGDLPLAQLVRGDAGEHLELLPPLTGDREVGDLVADWAVANLLDDPAIGDGRFAYDALPHPVVPITLTEITGAGEVRQLGADYLLIPPAEQARRIVFEGDPFVPVTGAVLPEDGVVWWSGRGDGRVAVLTRTLDLRGLSSATLGYRVWYDLESGYDYTFVAASTDGGRTWRTLQTRYGTSDDPHGLNVDYGYTGRSDGAGGQGLPRWLDDEVDLTPFAGKEVVVGFWTVNDQGYNTSGLLLADLEVPELGGPITEGWQSAGFVPIRNRLRQQWEVRLVLDGLRTAEVRAIEVQKGRAEVEVPPGMRAVLVVMAATPDTTEPGRYRATLLP